jgi:hypothetical protein
MHTALVSRLMKDRSAWELAHVPMEPAPDEENAPPEGNVNVNIPVLVSA